MRVPTRGAANLVLLALSLMWFVRDHEWSAQGSRAQEDGIEGVGKKDNESLRKSGEEGQTAGDHTTRGSAAVGANLSRGGRATSRFASARSSNECLIYHPPLRAASCAPTSRSDRRRRSGGHSSSSASSPVLLTLIQRSHQSDEPTASVGRQESRERCNQMPKLGVLLLAAALVPAAWVPASTAAQDRRCGRRSQTGRDMSGKVGGRDEHHICSKVVQDKKARRRRARKPARRHERHPIRVGGTAASHRDQ